MKLIPDEETRGDAGMGEENNMDLVTFDARDGVIQPVAEEYNGVRNRHCFLTQTGLSKHAWNDRSSSAGISSPECADCHHHHCRICDECSAPKQYSDYWICHQCGELNRRVPSLVKRGVSWIGKKSSYVRGVPSAARLY